MRADPPPTANVSSPHARQNCWGARALGVCRRVAIVAVVALVPFAAAPLGAQQADSARAGVRPRQDTTRVVPRPSQGARVGRDALEPPVSPGRAFLLSLAVPGLGQARLNRPTAGAVYVTAEAVWLAMLAKAANDLRIAKKHANDVVVVSWRVDPVTGAPVVSDGAFVVEDSLRSRYAPALGESDADQQQRSRVKARRLHLEDWVAMLVFNHLFSGADAFVSAQLWDLPAQVEVRALPSGVGLGARVGFR